MENISLNDQIEAVVRGAITKVLDLQKQHVVSAFGQVNGASHPVANGAAVEKSSAKTVKTVSAKKPTGPKKVAKTVAKTAKGKTAKEKSATNIAKGIKRDPAVLAALVEKLHAHILKNPGERIEKISAALKTPSKDLTLPVKKLIKEKRIGTKNQKRATEYYPA